MLKAWRRSCPGQNTAREGASPNSGDRLRHRAGPVDGFEIGTGDLGCGDSDHGQAVPLCSLVRDRRLEHLALQAGPLHQRLDDIARQRKRIDDILDRPVGERIQHAEDADGEEGVQLAQQREPDLILSDVMMPKLNGYIDKALELDPDFDNAKKMLLKLDELEKK